MIPTDLDDPRPFPRDPLPPLQHQQVRQFLVREASSGARRRTLTRRLVPAAVALVTAAGVVTAVTVLPREDRGGRGAGPAVVPEEPFVDDGRCGASQTAPLAQAPAGVVRMGTLEAGWTARATRRLVRWCTDPSAPVAAYRRVSGDLVTAAITVAVRVTPRAGTLVADDPWADGVFAPLQVRGHDGRSLRPDPASGDLTAPLVLRWREADHDWELRSSGITPDELAQVADGLRLSGASATWPDAARRGWTVTPLRAATPTGRDDWADDVSVEAGPAPRYPGDAAVSVTWGRRAGRVGVDLSVRELPARVVDVSGHSGVLLGGSLLQWDAGDGVLVSVTSAGALGGEALLGYARTVAPVAASDPRVSDQATP